MSEFGFFQYWRLRATAAVFRQIATQKLGPLRIVPSDSNSEAVQIPSRDDGRTISARLYFPSGKNLSALDSTSPLPILINWHGGGFIMNNFGLDHEFCARVAQENKILVLDADYRKGPECPFPAAIHDVEDTLKWVEGRPSQFDIDRVAVSGFSSGGVLALVAGSTLRAQFPKLNIRIPVIFYGGSNLHENVEEKTVPHPINAMPAAVLRTFFECYVPNLDLRTDPKVSPLFADPALFPSSIVIFTCSGDTLAPECEVLADRLNNAERKVTFLELENVGHAFDKGATQGSEEWVQKEKAYGIAIKELHDALLDG